jgi:hypothetical protein
VYGGRVVSFALQDYLVPHAQKEFSKGGFCVEFLGMKKRGAQASVIAEKLYLTSLIYCSRNVGLGLPDTQPVEQVTEKFIPRVTAASRCNKLRRG